MIDRIDILLTDILKERSALNIGGRVVRHVSFITALIWPSFQFVYMQFELLRQYNVHDEQKYKIEKRKKKTIKR